MPSTQTLTTRQARFVQEYLLDGNGAGSAVRAGYSASGAHVTASRMLRNATPVAQALQARQSADATRLNIKRENVVAALLEAVATAREQKDAMAMVRGLSEIAKMMGFCAPRQIAVTPTDGGLSSMSRMSKMTDAELLALITSGGGGGGAAAAR